jgi:hypothetical protein
MTSYKLTILGTDYSENALIDSVSITYGRNTITEQPGPATFSCTLSVPDGTVIDPIGLDSVMNFQVYDTYQSEWRNLFSGYVSDVAVTVGAWGNGNGLIEYVITGIGHLSRFNRVNVGVTGFVKKHEGDRINAIMIDGAITVGGPGIELPGAYELAAVSNGNYDALQLAQDAANSAMGVLCDTPDDDDVTLNPVTYVSYTSRSSAFDIALTGSEITAGGLSISKSMTDIVNKAWVTYGASSNTNGTIYTDTGTNFDTTITGTRNTYLHNSSDANSVAQILLAARKTEQYKISQITISENACTAAILSDLYGIRNGWRLKITTLPFNEVTNFDGFIEGWTWNINKNGSTLMLNLSSYGQNFPYTLWNQVGTITDTWNTIYTSTTTWEDVI